jgi:hypothetical protein
MLTALTSGAALQTVLARQQQPGLRSQQRTCQHSPSPFSSAQSARIQQTQLTLPEMGCTTRPVQGGGVTPCCCYHETDTSVSIEKRAKTKKAPTTQRWFYGGVGGCTFSIMILAAALPGSITIRPSLAPVSVLVSNKSSTIWSFVGWPDSRHMSM